MKSRARGRKEEEGKWERKGREEGRKWEARKRREEKV